MPLPNPHYFLLSDKELFDLVRQDDIKAYEVIYERHWPRLFEAAYKRLFSRQKAEDILQELFISLYKRRQEIDITVSLQSYLNQALKYKVLNEYRAKSVQITFQKNYFFNPVSKNDFADEFESKELSEKIEVALNALPQKCREAFLLSRKGDLSNKEISDHMQISVSTVEKHIGKALRILRNSVREYQVS
ncbi:MAG: RNA polymerase sigma-70 factor [Chitinophagaceae bacterium]|nr:MAG: RNA polymerase sigma-70 factor [Chitinophagaceae bacterium]